MSITLQEFFANGVQKVADDLETALHRVPEDKRTWSPMNKARSANDQIAECALLNGSTAELIKSRAWDKNFDMESYSRTKAELAQNGAAALSLLKENTPKVIAAIKEVPDADLGISVDMPWGPMTLAQIISYPYWNMCYHEGQINYIASMLGCLD